MWALDICCWGRRSGIHGSPCPGRFVDRFVHSPQGCLIEAGWASQCPCVLSPKNRCDINYLMAAPVLIGILGQAMVQAVTRPWPWLTLLGFFAVSKFDFGVFADEIRITIWSLWPFVVLVILLWFALLFFRSYLKLSRGKKKR